MSENIKEVIYEYSNLTRRMDMPLFIESWVSTK